MSARVKVGFHAGLGGNRTGIGDYFRRLDEAGVPFVIKSVNDVGLAVEAADYARRSGVDHVIVLRFTNPGGGAEVPDYRLGPDVAAWQRWEELQRSLQAAPEFGPYQDLIWLEVDNEPRTKVNPDDPMFEDMAPADWLGWYGWYLGHQIIGAGLRLALFGMNGGEPEPVDWRLAGMKRLLQLAGENPDQLAVALHEYTFSLGRMAAAAPHLMGRFKWLFDSCQAMGIARPQVLITEAGWTYNQIPGHALEDVAWYAEALARFPEVLGAMLWRLDSDPGIAGQLQALLRPITEFALATTYPDPPPAPLPPPEEDPPPESIYQELVEDSRQEQIDRGIWINPDAALVKAIAADEFWPVHRELYAGDLAYMGAEHPITGVRRVYLWDAIEGVRWIPG